MVSKVAVIALVAIVACPILLGYAFNLTETTETEYTASGEAVNVTPILQNGTGYSYANGETYQNNSSFGSSYAKIMPNYNSIGSTTKTAFQMRYYYVNWGAVGTQSLSGIEAYYIAPFYDHTQYSVNFTIYSGSTPLITVNDFEALYYDAAAGQVTYTRYSSGTTWPGSYTNPSMDSITFTRSGPVTPYTTVGIVYTNNASNTDYVDIAGGYYFSGVTNNRAFDIHLPEQTRRAIMSVDLDSITDPNYTVDIVFHYGLYRIRLEKTTVGSVVSWTASSYRSIPNVFIESYDLYYDPTRSDNTYQFISELTPSEAVPGTSTYSASLTATLRYIGGWSKLIGEANYYQSYEFTPETVTHTAPISINAIQIQYKDVGFRTPTVRIDSTLFRSFEYPIIENKTYDPASFKTNPATTITGNIEYGRSLSFGGNTYTVKDGNITIGTHEVPVKGLVLSSVPDGNGGYDNKIGNTIISNTAQPSTITFNGIWSASISTQSMESQTVTKTEWKAGSFAWDGIDHNFLLVGLITCLGVFIGCGIYAKKTRSGGIIPVMIVCGGAALMFFLML